jgi:Ca2+-binding RTX toxin-like protein
LNWNFERGQNILEGDIQLSTYSAQAEDRVGNQSAVWEYQTFEDLTDRTQMLRSEFDPNAVYANAQEASIWDGLSSGTESVDYRVLGSMDNDLFKNLDSGDIYLGGAGYDIAEFATNANFLGIGFANSSELDGVTNLLMGINPNQELTVNQIDSTPLLKLFSQSPFDDTEQGLSFVQSDLIRYTDNNQDIQTIYMTQDQTTGAYTLNLASTNNFLFFDGQGVLVNGGNQTDDLIGGAYSDVFFSQSSGAGIDKLTGGLGDDILVAGSTQFSTFDRTTIEGGEGDDRIYLVNGQLTSSGGQGADSFYVAPSFYGENAALQLKVTDFEVGVDKLFLPDSVKEYALNHLEISDDGLNLSINLHSASLDANTSLGYGSRIELMFEEAVSVPDAQDIFTQLILIESESYRSWDDLNKDWV